MGGNMGGGCSVWTPTPRNYSGDQGGRHSSKIDGGGLSQNMGARGAWGSCQKINVKEFDSKVAGYYKPASLQIY